MVYYALLLLNFDGGSMKQVLGQLQEVELRKVWNDEAKDFTPWLASNEGLGILAETLGMEFDDVRTEESVGSFSANIVCTDSNDGTVLIENQLEKTDHKHLGQLLTYAAGLQSVSVIWVAEKIRDEHRAALDWLNEITDTDYHFFGIEIALRKIDNSPPAPIFNIVSNPNDWSKAVRATSRWSEAERLQNEYWTKFKAYLEENTEIKPQEPAHRQSQYFPIGGSNSKLVATFLKQKGVLRVGFRTKGEQYRAIYELLREQHEEIHKELDFTLEWTNKPKTKRAGARIEWSGIDAENRERWGEYCKWMADHLEKMDACFRPRVRNLNPEDWTPPPEDEEE